MRLRHASIVHRMTDSCSRPEAARALASALAVPVLALVFLAGCDGSYNCYGGSYRGGCVAGPAPTPPAYAAPVIVPAATAPPALGAVPYGDPALFADVDDKQCRSYGLTFGGHDYADCRIRLSAQHRGLDPNIGTAPR